MARHLQARSWTRRDQEAAEHVIKVVLAGRGANTRHHALPDRWWPLGPAS